MGKTWEYKDLKALLEPFQQTHLLAGWEDLSEEGRARLAAQIRELDLPLIARLFRDRNLPIDIASLVERAVSPRGVRLDSEGAGLSPADAYRLGQGVLQRGEVAALLVAGGQGTRLGFPHPKGMFPIGPISGHSLFQIHVEKVLARSRKAGCPIPLAVMTSPATHQETVEFFSRHGRFGLPEEDLYFFCQGTMPSVDAATGKILLSAPGDLALSPDGHGGMLAAIIRSGTLEKLASRGIKYLFYFQVDNPLVDILSPSAIGYHIYFGSEMSTEVVAKETPFDRVGNVIEVDGRLYVVEYSDLPDELAQKRSPDGRLLLWAGSIGVHIINVDFLFRMYEQVDALPYHLAYKKVPYYDPASGPVTPTKPNAIKFERFIFDLIPHAKNAIVIEVNAAQHFAPLKNAPGADRDTPEHVRQQMIALHRSWLERNQVAVCDGVAVEISPLFAVEPDDLKGRFPPGYRITEPTFFSHTTWVSSAESRR
ncbi:MAG TPA: UDPGP type 1 family protein [Thermogutta sp.]|nr:UDPGP type 1 family protein [Thermogutta sp.]HOP77323.1 UDPGP type 1 family protein [Thermogutta sp.]HPU06104.1 UDPGP type 1 family protein [Thermogutta sp.]HPZ82769.1 UDPGP type 1 family protein [Thermogutta sp.]HQF13949.1 UDPGP type 1 family protein [Thermogutta sp.]